MIERVQNQTQLQPDAQTRPQQTNAPDAGRTFAATLAQETARSRPQDAKPQSAQQTSLQRVSDTPEGETWRPVRGRSGYAEIATGPRAGQFINLTNGARRGETFTIQERDGKTFHVYGSGDDEKAIEVRSGRRGGSADNSTPGRRETWQRVEGHNNYADILTGSRNGWYVNISGGSRHGQVFHIVERGGKTYHVYGRGDDKLWVEIRPRPQRTPEASGGSEATGPTPDETSSGGVAAPGTDTETDTED